MKENVKKIQWCGSVKIPIYILKNNNSLFSKFQKAIAKKTTSCYYLQYWSFLILLTILAAMKKQLIAIQFQLFGVGLYGS
jgi:hypothetical protein